MDDKRNISVTVRLHNHQLKRRRLALGMSQETMAKKVGTSLNSYSALECLRQKPYREDGSLTIPAQKVVEYFCTVPEDIFPEIVSAVTKNRVTIPLDDSSIVKLAAGDAPLMLSPSAESSYDRHELRVKIDEAMNGLSPRQRLVLRKRFGLDDGSDGQSFVEIASDLGISAPRVAQICAKALRLMRHPSRTKNVKIFAEPEYRNKPPRNNADIPFWEKRDIEIQKRLNGYIPEKGD